ncbi:phosphoglycolate phosphatase [Neomegalonema perideroedes]|uniref:phosphoglycolate phosphatase n=1 Tax=Neomegalonema perideroedes TaxID=217219 RepID=UPI0003A69D04|nr:phosphoglycolate phosphatase [Neomegalonema perideroedes]
MTSELPRAVIFDLDGTLVDTAPDLVGALNDLLAVLGLPPVTLEQGRAASGRGGRSLIKVGHELAGIDLTEAGVDALYPRYLEHYAARTAVDSAVYPGVTALLDHLEAQGWRLGICTNKPLRFAESLMRALGLRERFGVLLGADSLPVRKPDPRHLVETLERLGVEPDRGILLGDTETDLKTARAVGIPVALTSFGYAPVPVATYAPDAIFHHYDEAPEMIDRLWALGRTWAG